MMYCATKGAYTNDYSLCLLPLYVNWKMVAYQNVARVLVIETMEHFQSWEKN